MEGDDASTFAKNRERFLALEAGSVFLAGVVNHSDVRRQMSRDHFSADGTLIDAWACMKSFRPKDEDRNCGGDDAGRDGGGRNAVRDFRGERRSNKTHASTTDPDAPLYRKAAGQPSLFCFVATALMESRNGLLVDARQTRASSDSEGLPAVDLADTHIRPGGMLAGDKGFDTADLVAELRERRITPHVAQNHYDTGRARRRSNIDGRTE